MINAPTASAQTDQREVSLCSSDPAAPLTVEQVLLHVSLIQRIMCAAMKEGEHYGRIPGCGDKPTLLKPGAEKLCLLFRLAPAYDVKEHQHERGHREYRVTATLTSIASRALVGQGVGAGSTLENKYRFRSGPAEITDRAVPRVYWEVRQEEPAKAQELIGGKGFSVRKVEGVWMVAKSGEKVETDNPADHYNTVLKMAKKRALVDAVLTTTAASDIFTQDLDDLSASLAALAPAAAEPAAAPLKTTDAPAALAPLATTATSAPPAPVVESPEAGETQDFRFTRIHFGKNRGLALAELTPQQIHWYEEDWMPKKEAAGTNDEGDLALMAGLKAYRRWRNAEKQAQAAANPRPRRARRPAKERTVQPT